MVDGIGLITAACSRNMVCRPILNCILFTKFTETVYYRSKDSKLPDGPSEKEVFFDVRSKDPSEFMCTSPLSAQCFVKRRLCFSEYYVLLA